jgi:colicin import membrane protein
MKKPLLLLLAASFAVLAVAQPQEDLVAAAVQKERVRINAERAALETGFDMEEAACYKKFFVNSCLKDVQPRRREAMALLRQQEVALNDRERKDKAAAQIRKTEEKSSPEAQQQAAERRAQALEETRERAQRSQQKADERGTLQQKEALNAADTAARAKGSQERAQARADKKAAVAEEVQRYNEKQQEVKERKASREQKRREQTKPPANTLPARP